MFESLFIQLSALSLFALAAFEWQKIRKLGSDSQSKVFKIAALIKSGSMVYLMRQLKVLTLVMLLIFAVLVWKISLVIAIAFMVGGLLSWLCGFLGMYLSVEANHRVAFLAKKGFKEAFDGAFGTGKAISYMVSAVAITCASFAYFLTASLNPLYIIEVFFGLSFGSSLVSIFARLGGGIFTKGADVGADLVGKIEQGIPEDDPRNPAVIADNVGDNVGDCAGMAADLFESYIVMISGAISLAFCIFQAQIVDAYIKFALVVLASGAIGSMLTLMQGWKINESAKFSSLGIAFKMFFLSSSILSISSYQFFKGLPGIYELTLCALIGLAVAAMIMPLIEYYTSGNFSPVKNISEASETGDATNVIQGLAYGLESCFVPMIVIAMCVVTAIYLNGIFGLAVSCVAMLSVCPVILALDAFGPVTDNAGGLVEMGGLDDSVRVVTDKLDSLGNMTKATTKGYAVLSAALASLVLFTTYRMDLEKFFPNVSWSMDLGSSFIVAGILVGASLVSLFASIAMKAVGRASAAIVEEVRTQFKEMPGIMDGTQEPLYSRAIDYLTKSSLKEMIIPGLLPILGTIFLFVIMKACFNEHSAFLSLGGLIMGASIVGIFVAFSMTTGGGAWDNAKKYIEANGKKGSDAHKAAVTGDMVGDPYKDTAGPALNPMIKLIAIVAFLCILASK